MAQQRRRVRPMLETLEDRLTPSTVTENAADAATLQTDLNNATAANTQYVINLTGASAAYNLTAGQQLTVSAAASGSSVTIAGTGQSITGNGNRVFNIEKGANVTLQDLTITGGSVAATAIGFTPGGGLFDNGGNVTLSNVTVKGNSAIGKYAEGGGICVTDGNLTIEGGSIIQNNSALGSSSAGGGGVYVIGASTLTVTIRDSILRDNIAQGGPGDNGTAAGKNGNGGGSAAGGGLSVYGSNWTVTLSGDTLVGNSAVGGDGGFGADGVSASASNSSGGNGGNGGGGGSAVGGGAYFNGQGNNTLTILNDLSAPATGPTLFDSNLVQGGNGGDGGNGGGSTGTAKNSNGGDGGQDGGAEGAGLYIGAPSSGGNITLGNITLYGNDVVGGNGGAGGTAGTGGSGGSAGASQIAGSALGGGLVLSGGNVTMVNNTVANNTVTAGSNGGTNTQGAALGGGIFDFATTATLDNNTITQNVLRENGPNGQNNTTSGGTGIFGRTNATLLNNLIQDNQSVGSSAYELDTDTTILSNASNNFITSINPSNAVSTTTNIVGNSQTQLGGVVGVTSDGNPSGGPIYYPLLSGVVSIGYGSTSALSTIAAVEGTTTDKTTDEIGDFYSTQGVIDLGAVQSQSSSPSSAPTITGNPSSQSVTAGANVSFTASANGNPIPSVQWQVSTDGGKTFSNLSGATSTTLTLSNVGAAMNGNEYQAVFTNSAGNATTSVATLTVNVPPSITGNPSNQTVTAGANASFTASASGTPTPSVQWQISTNGGNTFTNISGATSTTLTLNNVSAAMNGNEYQAVFTNSAGSATTTAATLTVNAAPSITGNPSNQTVTAGSNVSFTASASGNPTPTVQWQISTDGGKTFTDINGATSSTLTLNNVSAGMNGDEYQAVFTNSVGSATTTAATLTVNTPPSIASNPTNATLTAGQTATFTASAIGAPTPTVQWQVSSDGGKTFNAISGATSTTLTLNNVTTAMNGNEYQAVFTNSAGNATTTAATLTVNAPPSITVSPISQTVTAGANVVFTASASGTPTPTVQWQVSSDGGSTFTNISGATSTTLTLNNVTTALNGDEYQAVFTNSAGTATTSAATLTIHTPPPPPPPPPPPAPPSLNVPPLLALFDQVLGGVETVNANGTETITDRFFGIPLLVSTFDSSGNLVSVDLFGFNITSLFG